MFFDMMEKPKGSDDGTVYMTDLKSVAHLGLRVRIPLGLQKGKGVRDL